MNTLQWALAFMVLVSPVTAGYSLYRSIRGLRAWRRGPHLRLRGRIAPYSFRA